MNNEELPVIMVNNNIKYAYYTSGTCVPIECSCGGTIQYIVDTNITNEFDIETRSYYEVTRDTLNESYICEHCFKMFDSKSIEELN